MSFILFYFLHKIRLLVCYTTLPISVYLIIRLADEISWTEFKIIGASDQFQDIYRQSGYFVSLLKLDFQLSTCALILEFKQGPFYIEAYSFVLVLVGLPLCLVTSLIGYRSVRLESLRSARLFLACQICMPVFICHQLYQIYNLPNVAKIDDYIVIYASMFVDAMVLVLKGVLVYETRVVAKNFDQGLKERGKMHQDCTQVNQLIIFFLFEYSLYA